MRASWAKSKGKGTKSSRAKEARANHTRSIYARAYRDHRLARHHRRETARRFVDRASPSSAIAVHTEHEAMHRQREIRDVLLLLLSSARFSHSNTILGSKKERIVLRGIVVFEISNESVRRSAKYLKMIEDINEIGDSSGRWTKSFDSSEEVYNDRRENLPTFDDWKSAKRMMFREGLTSGLLRLWIFLVLSIGPVVGLKPGREENRTFAVYRPEIGSIWIQPSHRDDVNVEHLPKNNYSNNHRNFTEWSEWSVCDRHCTQNRVKRCRIWKKCGDTVLRAERSCYHKRKGRRRRCSQRRRRGGRRDNNQFHVVQIPQQAEPRHGSRRGKKGSRKRPVTHYGKWSKWSPCSRACTTQRHRWCRRPGICGRDVIRESAYCYVEGSFCQKWIHRKIRGSHEDDIDDPVLDEFEIKPYTVPSSGISRNDDTWKCGLAGNGKDSRLSYMTRIVGGQPATPGSWPWQVAVLNRYREAFCGGTLVSRRWILTAAHCIRKRLYVRIGEHDLTVKEGTELEFRVDSMTVHPEYDADTVDNDVALLRLPVTLSSAASRGIACLPTTKQPLPANQLCTIIGWGKSRATDDYGTDVLHEAKIPIVSEERCRDVYVDYKITDNMFCAGYRRGRMDSCAGDSGGPLLCRDPKKPHNPWTIFGITSFGEGCGKRGKYGIYAKITNYVRWIAKVMKESDTTSRRQLGDFFVD